MTNATSPRRWTGYIIAIAAIVLLSIPVSGESLGARFIASLRIAKPAPVSAGAPSLAPAANSRHLDDVVLGILAETTVVASDDPDRVVAIDSAARLVTFRPRLLHARTDPPFVSTIGARSTSARVDAAQLRTLLGEAGRAVDSVPTSVDGADVSVSVPTGVRVAYGNCPAPEANTLAAQLNGPPPPTAQNSSCVVLTETAEPAVRAPPALDTAAVLELALELTGMSPDQARDFRGLFSWRESLVLAPPRFMRSYEIVHVGGTPAMLMITAGRRGAAYELAWIDAGVVFALTGYGSPGDAVPLAASAAP